jgi:hypothetical protein
MLTASECRTHSEICARLGTKNNISVQRAAILLAMSRSWTALAGQADQYEAVLKKETRRLN